MNKKIYIIFAIGLFVFAIMLFELFLGKNSLIRQNQITEEIAAYQAEIDSLKQVIETRNQEINRLQNDSMYKESILRTRYGMSREGEKVFQLIEPKTEK